MTIIGVLLFLLTLFEIIDMSWEETWGEGFYGSLYYVFMLLGVGLIVFGVNKGFIDDTLVGTLGVLCGCAVIWLGWESRT